jgi:hypothetical protein
MKDKEEKKLIKVYVWKSIDGEYIAQFCHNWGTDFTKKISKKEYNELKKRKDIQVIKGE